MNSTYYEKFIREVKSDRLFRSISTDKLNSILKSFWCHDRLLSASQKTKMHQILDEFFVKDQIDAKLCMILGVLMWPDNPKRYEELLLKALDLEPDYWDALYLYSVYLSKKGRFKEFIPIKQRLFAVEVLYHHHFIDKTVEGIAYAYYQLENYSKALEYYEKVLTYDAFQTPDIYYFIARSHLLLKNFNEALSYVRKGLHETEEHGLDEFMPDLLELEEEILTVIKSNKLLKKRE